jgi:hypothetical protein
MARLATAERLTGSVLAEYLQRADAYFRDQDLLRLRAELREARREKRVPTNEADQAPKARQRQA